MLYLSCSTGGGARQTQTSVYRQRSLFDWHFCAVNRETDVSATASPAIRQQLGTLVMLRHGQSAANASGLFTGASDSPLTQSGRVEAAKAARLIRASIPHPDAVVSSTLNRALDTATIVRDAWAPPVEITIDGRLDERDYGVLTGMSKSAVRERWGDEWFLRWRRSVRIAPPGGESLAEVIVRVRDLWTETLVPLLHRGGTAIVVAHGNSLRALCAVVDGLSDDEVQELNIPTGQPLLYRIHVNGRPDLRGGLYLDPDRALAAAQTLTKEGGT